MAKDPFYESGLPMSDEAEKAMLGAILLENDRLDEAASTVPVEALHLDVNREIYRTMLAIREAGQPIDGVTLADELRRRGIYDKVRGLGGIAELTDGLPRTDTVAPYTKLILNSWNKRKLLNVGSSIRQMVLDDEIDYERMQSAAEQFVYELAEANVEGSGPRLVATVAAKLVDFYEAKAHDRSALIGLSTGFEDINARTLGLTPGVTVVAARTSHGKTALMTNIGTNVALEGKSVFMASIESSAEKIVQRILASMSRVDSYIMRQGRMNVEEWQRLVNSLERLTIAQFVIDDLADMTPDMLISRCRQHKSRFGLDLLIVDHIHEMEPGKPYRSVQEKIGHVMTGLRRASRMLDVPVLAAAQLSRAVDERPDHRPRLSDLSDASAIEKVADTVLMLYRKWMYTQDDADKGLATLIVGKNRDGTTEGDVHMAFFDEYTTFQDLAWDDWPKAERKSRQRKRAYFGSRTSEDE